MYLRFFLQKQQTDKLKMAVVCINQPIKHTQYVTKYIYSFCFFSQKKEWGF